MAAMTSRAQPDLFAPGVAEAVALAPVPSPAGPICVRRRLAAVDTLDEAETLQRLVARCQPGVEDPAGITEVLLARFGDIGHVLGAPHAELAQTVGWDIAAELTLLHALLVRALQYPLRRREALGSWGAVTTYLRARLTALPREVFHVLFLDTKNQLIADELMGEGTVNHAPVYPREVVRRALELSASAVLLVHNHPSGDPTPSGADIEVTKQVVAAAKALGIQVHDHVIVGGDVVVSLKQQGLM
jgi:DNA repair protein RadC